MGQPATPTGRSFLPLTLLVLGLACFATAYGQAPLYYSNQNQYFLHGLAQAGEGLLSEDWLANTLDPTPLFSGLVALTARYLHPWAFHLYHGLLLAAYAAAMLGLFTVIAGESIARQRWLVFLALLIAVHAALARWLSYRLLGLDYPWYFQCGFAGQYVLGAMLQPSVFGVLLIVAICLFVRGHPVLAAVCVALGATMHSTYLLPGALVTLGFLTVFVREGRLRQALGLGTLTLVLVLPVVAYVVLTFGPTTPETFAEAQDILVNVRIPHHARPDLWLDPIAGLQIAWILLGLKLVYKKPLYWVLAVPTLGMMVLMLVQVATGSHTLALLFPWRVSSVILPIATTIILSRLVALPVLPRGGGVARALAVVAVVGLAVAGVWISVGRHAFRLADEEVSVMEFVRSTRASGDVYLLPVRVPNLVKTTRGSLSSDFKPPAAKRKDARIIPIDLQRFRLGTGTPIFVDFKSIPYKDTEVIEWRDRLRKAEKLQTQIRNGQLLEVAAALSGLHGAALVYRLSGNVLIAQAMAELRRLGVTHLVLSARGALPLHGVPGVYSDAYYRVYRLTAGTGAR